MTGAPRQNGSYAAKCVMDFRYYIANYHPSCDGRMGLDHLTGSTADILSLAMFDFWESIYYIMPVEDYPFEKKHVG